MLVYAKLTGFPYWPAKVLRAVGSQLDVRFFGEAHDRSLVPIDKCFWLSEQVPNNTRNCLFSKQIQIAGEELNKHVKMLLELYGNFNYAEQRKQVELHKPHIFIDQIKGKKY